MRPSFANNLRPKKQRAHATLKRGRREDRVRAAPAVSCASMHNKKCAHEHTGSAETLRPSLRSGFTTYTRSPWRPGFLVTITRVMRSIIARLTPTLGRRDHTLSPYAGLRIVTRNRRPPQPAPTSVTTADAPSWRDGMASVCRRHIRKYRILF